MLFELASRIEGQIESFFGSRYAIANDSSTHGIELSKLDESIKRESRIWGYLDYLDFSKMKIIK